MRVRIFAAVAALMFMAMPVMGQSLNLGSLISALTGGKEVTVDNITGTWVYSAPAVSFKSDNLLKKAGGVAASAAVVEKLEPYYTKLGFNSLELTIAEDSTFTMKIKKLSLKGTISSVTDDSDADLNFQFLLGGKVKAADMDAYVTLSGSEMDLTFDVSKLTKLMELAGNLTGNSTVKSVTTLLESYDGITAGFKLKRSE